MSMSMSISMSRKCRSTTILSIALTTAHVTLKPSVHCALTARCTHRTAHFALHHTIGRQDVLQPWVRHFYYSDLTLFVKP